MSDDTTYHVTKNSNTGKWQGKAQGASRASVTGDTKAEVMRETIDIAKNKDGSVIVHKQDGKFQEERTYRKDPYPPKG